MANKIILICCAYAASVVIGALIFYFDTKECMTNKCKEIAFMIKERVDRDVDPCDNFYEFACGKILRRNDTEDNKNSIVHKAAKEKIARLHNILEQSIKPHEPRAFKLAKRFYKLCKSNESLELQVQFIKKLFKETGGFPVLEGDKWNETGWTWLEATRKMRSFGLESSPWFSFSQMYNFRNTSMWGAVISNPSLIYSNALLKTCNLNCEKSVTDEMVELLVTLGADPAQAASEFKEVFSLAKQLALNCIMYPNMKENFLEFYNATIPLSDIISLFGFISWSEYIEIVIRKPVPNDTVILVLNENYLTNLKDIFEKTPKKVLANYMMIDNMMVLSRFMSQQNKMPEVREQCFQFMNDHLQLLLQSMYVNKYSERSYEKTVTQMVAEIKVELSKSINSSDWMDLETKEEALGKVVNMAAMIGYPDEFLSASAIDNYHRTLSITDSKISSVLNIFIFNTDKIAEKWFTPITVNNYLSPSLRPMYLPMAYYHQIDNSINILHGILEAPIFENDWPHYINYGRTGSAVGHEVTHGLDSTGCFFDKDRKVRNWWKEGSYTRFVNKSQCFVDQFNNFLFFNGSGMQNLSGELEVNENIADAGGIKLSFLAYRDYCKKHYWPEVLLPGLDYTQEQMFFISFAHFYCKTYTKTDYIRAFHDVHAPSEPRVIGTLQNTPYFKKVFKCKEGSTMAPKKTCKLW